MLQRVSLQMFKYSRNTLPEVIHELFITNDTFHSHNTRNKNKLRSKMSNQEYMYKNFSFIGGVYIWNDIQDHAPINTSYLVSEPNPLRPLRDLQYGLGEMVFGGCRHLEYMNIWGFNEPK